MKNAKSWKFVILFLILIYLISYFSANAISSLKSTENKIALIKINGPIMIDDSDSSLLESGYSSIDSVISNIKKAKEDDSVKGVVFEINSPGGSVVATQDLANAVSSLNKPKVAYIREIGASGAYWVASASDKIVASPMAITGSIGVVSSYLEFSKLFEKYGITYQSLTSGEFKDMGSPYKELTVEEREMMQKKINIIYEYFVSAVAKNRNMPVSDVRKLADGSFYLGVEAKELGLIDYVGDEGLAVNITKQLAGVEKANLVTYKEKKSLISYLTKLSSYYIGQGIGVSLLKAGLNIPEIKFST